MKKILTKIVLALTTLSLVGCGSSANLSDGSTELVSGAVTITKADIFTDMKKQSGAKTYVLQEVLEILAKKEEIDIDEIKAECDDIIAEIKESSAAYIEYYGEDTLYDYYYSADLEGKLIDKYIDYNYDTIVAENPAYKCAIVSFDNLQTAQSVLDLISAGSSFEDAVAQVDSTQDTTVQVYLDSDSDLNVDVKEYINSNDPGVSSIVTAATYITSSDGATTASYTYYIINLVSKNIEDFKDEYIETYEENLERADVYNYFFKKYNVAVYDQDIYEALSEVYDSLK